MTQTEQAQPAKLRLQFDFSGEATGELTELQQVLGVATRADVVKHALGLLQWVVNSKRDGWDILVEKDGAQKLVVLHYNIQPKVT